MPGERYRNKSVSGGHRGGYRDVTTPYRGGKMLIRIVARMLLPSVRS